MWIQKSQFFSNHDEFFLFHLLFGCKLVTIVPLQCKENSDNMHAHAHTHTQWSIKLNIL